MTLPRHTRPMAPAEIAATTDEDIDFSDIPEMSDEVLKNAQVSWSDEYAESMGFKIVVGEALAICDDLAPNCSDARWLSWTETVALSRWLAAKVEQNK